MKATPLFLVACALASIGGIVSGATINTKMIQHAGIGLDGIDRPAIQFDPSDTGLNDQIAPPDHYALRTPEGRVEVADLSTRGLYSQHRFGWDAAWTPPPPAPMPEPAADPDWSYQPQEDAVQPATALQPATAVQSAVGQQPADLTATDAAPAGEPRLIVVQTALAEKG